MFWDVSLVEKSSKRPEKLHLATYGSILTLGRAWGDLSRMMKDLSNERRQGHHEKAVHRINRSGLMGAYRDQKASMESDIDPLQICNSCVAWCTCGTPNGQIRGCLWFFFCLLVEPFPTTRTPWTALVWWSLPGNILFYVGWCYWESCSFLRGDRGEKWI